MTPAELEEAIRASWARDTSDDHLWNRLPFGIEIDFTFDQFVNGETLGPPRIGEATPDTQPRIDLFRRRVFARLGLWPGLRAGVRTPGRAHVPRGSCRGRSRSR